MPLSDDLKKPLPVYTRDEKRAVLFMKLGRGCARCCADPACRRARLCLRYYEGCLALPEEGVDAGLRPDQTREVLEGMPTSAPPDAQIRKTVARAKRKLVADMRSGKRQNAKTQGRKYQFWLGGKPLYDIDDNGLYRTMPPLGDWWPR